MIWGGDLFNSNPHVAYPMSIDRRSAAARSLDGLFVGDAFGESFFSIQLNPLSWDMHISSRTPPNWGWRWTDDTAMAVSIVEVLNSHGTIDQDALATAFAQRYRWDDRRGYGGTAHGILMSIGEGLPWSQVAPAVMNGCGSMGNGAAMRVAPLGAYFSDDPEELVIQATRSAEITHAHPEGKAGAIAVALAAAFAQTNTDAKPDEGWRPFFEFVLKYTPDSETRALIVQARDLPSAYAVETAVSVLGNGSRIVAPDTVPFCLWCAARSLGNFEDAMWLTVSGGGDMDTTCAIVGGIIASCEPGAPPASWLARRERLPAPLP
jgi:ADP-ribosylglycohydrolase